SPGGGGVGPRPRPHHRPVRRLRQVLLPAVRRRMMILSLPLLLLLLPFLLLFLPLLLSFPLLLGARLLLLLSLSLSPFATVLWSLLVVAAVVVEEVLGVEVVSHHL